MRSLITWVPAFIAFFMLFFRSPSFVLMYVYLPVLFFLPQTFQALTSGFPKLSFSETTLIPIFIFFWAKDFLRWKPSLTDFFVIGFIVCKFISAYLNGGVHIAINRLAFSLCDNLAPYVLAKGLIYNKNLNVDVAKKIVIFVFVDVLISFFEALTSINPHLDPIAFLFFPGNQSIPLIRFGMTRIIGPFGEAIFYGMAISLAILFNYWLMKNRYWKLNFSIGPPLPLSKGKMIVTVLLIGFCLNLSRGPILACLLGFILMGVAFAKRQVSSFFARAAIACLILISVYLAYYNLQFLDQITSETASTAAYRFRLIDVYLDVGWEKPWFGWLFFPTKNQSLSIDNEYLYLFLSNGILALIFFCCSFLWVMIRLFFRGLKTKKSNFQDSSFAYTLMSILFSMALCFFTVYMGNQIEHLFFLVIGWAEGQLLAKPIQFPPAELRRVS